jgi:hypothetical protein
MMPSAGGPMRPKEASNSVDRPAFSSSGSHRDISSAGTEREPFSGRRRRLCRESLLADALNVGVSVARPWVRARSLAVFTSPRSKRACGSTAQLGLARRQDQPVGDVDLGDADGACARLSGARLQPPSAATIVHDLGKPGHVTNVRGRSGGICVARQAKEINRRGRSARRR